MSDVIVGVIAVVVGGLFCFRGYLALRIMIPIWGAFVGFFLGAGLVASFADDGFLSTALGWLVGIAVALLFAAIAYLYYEVSVMIAMASIGFALGSALMVWLGVSWSWVVVLVGVLIGALLAVIAIAGDLPTVLLVVLSALGGATAIVAGVMLIFGILDTASFTSDNVTDQIEGPWWDIAYVVIVIAGIVAQFAKIDSIRGSTRQTWVDAGGRTMSS